MNDSTGPSIIDPKEVAAIAGWQQQISAMPRDELEAAFLNLVRVSETAVMRVHALETDLDTLREQLRTARGKKNRKRVQREQVFELVEAFDPTKITKLPIPGRVFLLGHIDDMLIVEVPADSTSSDIENFKRFMRRSGLTSAALIISAGTRFMRLRPCTRAEEKEIYAQLQRDDDGTTEEAQAPAEGHVAESSGSAAPAADGEATAPD